MADQTITTRMELDLEPYRKALEKMPKDAQKALKELERTALSNAKKLASAQEKLSKRAASAVTKHARDQATAAKKAARETEAAYNEQFSAIMGLSGAAFGGIAGDIEDAFTVMQGMSGGLAAIGAGLAGLAIGGAVLSSVVSSIYAMGDAALEARDRLAETGFALDKLFTAEQLASLAAYEQGQKDLAASADVLAVSAGAGLADGLGMADRAQFNLNAAMAKYSDTVPTATEATGLFIASLLKGNAIALAFGLTVADAGDELRDKLDASKEATEATEEHTDATQEEYDALAGFNDLLANEVTPEIKKHTVAVREDTKAEVDHAAFIDALITKVREHNAAVAVASEAMKTHGYVVSDTLWRVEGLTDAEGTLTVAWDEGTRTAEERAEAYAKSMEKMAEGMRYVQGIGGEAANALAGFSELAQNAATEEATAKKKSAKSIGKTIKGLERMRETATGAELVQIQERIYARQAEQDNMRKLAKKANKRALTAWKAGKAAQISATIMNGIAAGIAFLAPPPLGLGPVAGGVAAGLLAGGVTAAVANIAATKPPKFHQGGIVAPPRQEVGALLETGEGVIRREAMMQPGATETVQRMNEGGGGGGQPMAVYLNDRLVDVLVARAERTDAQSRRGLAMVGTRTMYDRRR